ncbi:MAG: Veg family protein [Bacilli bacterium]
MDRIRLKVASLKGKKIKIIIDVGRNKIEEYDGFVLDTYKHIWTFKTDTDIKSFAYKDILINSVVLQV